jgi:hypothetical protein
MTRFRRFTVPAETPTISPATWSEFFGSTLSAVAPEVRTHLAAPSSAPAAALKSA